jgi:hypothetical protein
MKKFLYLPVVLSGCASQPVSNGLGPGIFGGFIDGLLCFPSLILGLFSSIRIYSFPNSGYWYDVGFVIGLISSLVFFIIWLEANAS